MKLKDDDNIQLSEIRVKVSREYGTLITRVTLEKDNASIRVYLSQKELADLLHGIAQKAVDKFNKGE